MIPSPSILKAVLLIGCTLLQHVCCEPREKVNVINMSEWMMKSDLRNNDYQGDANKKKVVVGVLLPRDFPHPDDLAHYSRLDSVLPGVVLATQELQEVLPGWSWDILVGDTDCNSTTGPLQAVDMFYKNRCMF